MSVFGNEGVVPTMQMQPTMGGYGYGYPAFPVYGGGYGNDMGFGGSWLVLFILFMMMGWGGMGMMGGGFGGMGSYGMFPWLLASNNNTNELITATANQGATANSLSNIQGTLADQEIANCGRAMDQMRTAYQNEIASLERSYNAQTAIDNHLDTIDKNLAQCCCDNRLATENLRATILQENCQDRYEAQNNARDIIQNQNQGFQSLKDDIHRIVDNQKDETIASLRSQLYMKDLAASQIGQTADIKAGQQAQAQYIVNRVAPYPQPAVVVGYGCQGNGWGNGYGQYGGFGGNFAYGY